MILTPIVYLFVYSMAALGAVLIAVRYLMVWTAGALIIWCMLGIPSKVFGAEEWEEHWMLVLWMEHHVVELPKRHDTRQACVARGIEKMLESNLLVMSPAALIGFTCEVPKQLRTEKTKAKCLTKESNCA